MHRQLIVCALLLLLAAANVARAASSSSSTCAVAAGLVNAEVTRTIDLKTSIAQHTVSVLVRNTGSSAATRYHVAVPASQAAHVAWIAAEVAGSSSALTIDAACVHASSGATLYPVAL